MRNIAYVISNLDKAIAFEWISQYLDKSRFRLIFILLNPGRSYLQTYLEENKIKVYHIPYRGKKDLLKSVVKSIRIMAKEKIEIVHCHLFEASLVGLLSSKILGISKRVHTRHHATLHHVYFPRAVFYDKIINYLSTDIIAISENIQSILMVQEKVKKEKIHVIHHGFELENFSNPDPANIASLVKKYNPHQKKPVIGVISRYIEWKGIQYIIPAFQKLLFEHPDALLILANARGPANALIKDALQTLPADSYLEITFENDLFSLYHLFDIFVHTPVDDHSEAFGQTYVEALAAGIPSIVTLSGVAPEFIVHKENAMVVDFKNSEQIYSSMTQLLNDLHLWNALKTHGKISVKDKFDLKKMLGLLENIYE